MNVLANSMVAAAVVTVVVVEPTHWTRRANQPGDKKQETAAVNSAKLGAWAGAWGRHPQHDLHISRPPAASCVSLGGAVPG